MQSSYRVLENCHDHMGTYFSSGLCLAFDVLMHCNSPATAVLARMHHLKPTAQCRLRELR